MLMIKNFFETVTEAELILLFGFSFGVYMFVMELFVHISCLLAKVTKKKICCCWDCHNKCDFYKSN